MKKVFITILILAIVAGGVYAWWFTNHRLDGLVEREISEAAVKAFGTEISVDDVSIDILDQSLTIENLAIGNPPGFNNKNAFVFGTIEASVDFKTRGVDRVILDNSEIFVEEREGLINIQEIEKAISSKMTDTVSVGDSPGSDGEDMITIRQFLMRSTTATLESASFEKLTELNVDEIELRDLSGTPEQVAEQIASKVVEEILDEAQLALLRAKAEDVGERAIDKVKDWLDDEDN